MRTNALSTIGRLGYSTVWLFYPAAFGYYTFVHTPKKQAEVRAQAKADLEGQSKDKTVDPDLFNPFSAIPFHNNPEMKYIYAETNMRGYLDDNQMNLEDYWFKGYHNSFDHNNKKQYLYNWTSVGVTKQH